MADVTVDGLNRVMRALRDFPPEAGAELRDESQAIAHNLMVPAFQSAAKSVPSWGDILARSIRAKRDRVPSVSIGYSRIRVGMESRGEPGRQRVSGGASTVMLRWPTHSGDRGKSFAPFVNTGWINRAKTYKGPAMEAWGNALERVVTKWNRGGA